MKKLEEINIADLVKHVFPFSPDYEIVFSQFVKKGIAKWETWFVIIYRGEILNDYLLLTICGHSDYTRAKHLTVDFTLDEFKKDFTKAKSLHHFYSFNKFISQDYFIQLNEMNRLYSYLKIRHITLFEPTK